MYRAIDLFSGIGGLRIAFHDSYANFIDESILNDLITKCFDETPAYSLNSSIHPSQEEYHYARHFADLDIIELFSSLYVRNHRNYKYCRGKSDTANHVLKTLSEFGIYISSGKYNNWRREKDFRLIDDEALELLLELLRITPSEFKRLVYAHILVRREIRKEDTASDLICILQPRLCLKDLRFSKIKLSRPPCRRIA